MATTRRGFILATSLLAVIATILAIVSLVTSKWVQSDAYMAESTDGQNTIKFGLFSGVFTATTPVTSVAELTMVCLAKENICALMCDSTDDKADTLRSIYNHDASLNDSIFRNPSCKRFASSDDRDVYYRFYNSREDPTTDSNKFNEGMEFINAAVRGLTIFLLVFSVVFGAASSILAFLNIVYNPYQTYLSVFSLYFYNAFAGCGSMLTLILWGALFADKMRTNDIPMPATFFADFTTAGFAALGYSYWINIASLALFLANIALLYVRQYLIRQEPEVNVHLEDNKDPNGALLKTNRRERMV